MSAKLSRAAGSILSPFALLLARIGKSKRLSNIAVQCDPHNLAAHRYSLALERSKTGVFDRFTVASELSATLGEKHAIVLQDYFSRSKSQLLQDIVCILALDKTRDGYFLEIGVGNGVDISNTYLLEKSFGWSGLLIEPNRSSHGAIRKNRTAKLDIRAASNTASGSLEFVEDTGAGEFSKLSTSPSKGSTSDNKVHYQVEVAKLSDMLDQAGAPDTIDFLSLDTEGNEIDILNSLDLGRYKFGFMAIEHNFEPGKEAALELMLSPHGYIRILKNYSAFDAWFIHESRDSILAP